MAAGFTRNQNCNIALLITGRGLQNSSGINVVTKFWIDC